MQESTVTLVSLRELSEMLNAGWGWVVASVVVLLFVVGLVLSARHEHKLEKKNRVLGEQAVALLVDSIVVHPTRRRGREEVDAIERMKADLLAQGQVKPIVVVQMDNGEFHVEDGALRVLAVRALGWRVVWARVRFE